MVDYWTILLDLIDGEEKLPDYQITQLDILCVKINYKGNCAKFKIRGKKKKPCEKNERTVYFLCEIVSLIKEDFFV